VVRDVLLILLGITLVMAEEVVVVELQLVMAEEVVVVELQIVREQYH